MSLLMFFGALRISEGVAARKGDKTKVALQWQDVKVVDGMVQMHISQSKVDQLGRGCLLYTSPSPRD